MSYELRYQPNLCKKFPTSKHYCGRAWIKMSILVIGIVALIIGFRTSDVWKKFMIPGDPAKTVFAAENFEQNLKEGVSFETAFRTFCFEVVSKE